MRSRKPSDAWVRFSGPGPYITPDIDDVGFMSISIKLMGVPGTETDGGRRNLLVDMFGVSHAHVCHSGCESRMRSCRIESFKNAQIFYFLNFHRPARRSIIIMQALLIKTQSSPS